eukprot:gene5005-6097_t
MARNLSENGTGSEERDSSWVLASRMPICRFFAKMGECRDCNMYKLGFCIHGSLCRYRHTPLEGPPPPPEQVARCEPLDQGSGPCIK